MLKKIFFISFIIILFSSCASKCIVNDNSKFYSEVNTFEINNSQIKLTQKVRTNNTENGLHSGWYTLEIYFSNKSKIKEKKTYLINKDTTFFKVKYHSYSSRTWEIYAKKIKGTIEVKKLTNKSIEIKENIFVLDELNKKIIFKGIREFRNDLTEKQIEMKRNRKRLWIIKNKG